MSTDGVGLELSGASGTQATCFDQVMQDYLDYRLSCFPKLKGLCEDAPEFVLAHILKGYLLLSMGTRETIPAARKCGDHAAQLDTMMNGRERLHLRALQAWTNGETADAVRHWDAILIAWPLDILALKLQHFTLFWMGRPQHMRDAAARVLPAWDDTMPGYANVLGMLSFGLEETGDYTRAEALGREAVERQPDDLWAIHSVAHVYEMEGRLSDGISWLNQPLDKWDDRNPFKDHVWWHTALFAYDRGAYSSVLDLYDRTVRPNDSTFYLDVQNAASMLARLEFAGVDVGDRWTELAEVSRQRNGDHVLMFTEPHYTMAFGRTGQQQEADKQLASLHALASASGSGAERLIEGVVAPVCEAICSYYKGDYSAVTETMFPIRYDYQPIGGSHAQRDLFNLYLIDAATRDGRLELARSLLAERVSKHPSNHDTWRRYAHICDQLGETETASMARREIDRVSQSA